MWSGPICHEANIYTFFGRRLCLRQTCTILIVMHYSSSFTNLHLRLNCRQFFFREILMTCQFSLQQISKNKTNIQISLYNATKSLSKLKWLWWTHMQKSRLQVSKYSIFTVCWVLWRSINLFLLICLIFLGFFFLFSSTFHICII